MATPSQITHDRTTAISIALSAFLTAEQTADAMQLWQEKYANQPTFSVQYFARECCALFGVESERSQLAKSLVRELYVQKLKPSAEKLSANNQTTGPYAEAAMIVFHLLFRAMIASAGPLRGREISRNIELGLVKMPLELEQRRSLERWLNQNKTVIEMNLPIPILTTLINRAYIGLCEYFGPVKADQILHDAVNKASKTQEADIFDPRELL